MTDTVVSLPSLDEAPRCSPWSLGQGLAPAGTAIRADQLLLLDVPAPWPKPIRDHPRLLGMMDVAGNADTPTRLLASMPTGPDIRLTVFRNVDGRGLRSTFLIESEDAIPAAIEAACRGASTDAMTVIEPPSPRPTILVCTQGTHDICCGSDGVRFAREVEESGLGVDVYRVSHTGGHRFAPTAMTFPDGRMWAWLAADDVATILEGTADHHSLAARCRGWWGADRGAQQAAEVALFADRGWELDDQPRAVTGTTPEVEITVGAERVVVDVVEGRTVPTISCRSAGGQPTKTATEYIASPR